MFQGDRGGPIFISHALVGINKGVSPENIPFNAQQINLYTGVNLYREFIRVNTEDQYVIVFYRFKLAIKMKYS